MIYLQRPGLPCRGSCWRQRPGLWLDWKWTQVGVEIQLQVHARPPTETVRERRRSRAEREKTQQIPDGAAEGPRSSGGETWIPYTSVPCEELEPSQSHIVMMVISQHHFLGWDWRVLQWVRMKMLESTIWVQPIYLLSVASPICCFSTWVVAAVNLTLLCHRKGPISITVYFIFIVCKLKQVK